MIDAVAFVLLVAVFAFATWLLWRRIAGRSRRATGAAGRVIGCVSLALVVVATSVFHFIGSRTLQLFGNLVPRVETRDSIVALTFDDGPLPVSTDEILRALAAGGVKATFYLIGDGIERNPAEAEKIAAAGHEIGNHSYTHPRMVGLSMRSIASEIERTDARIRSIGHDGPIHFRSPYGKRFVALPWYLQRTGRLNILWDVEPDSHPEIARDAVRIVEHVLERARPGSIILLHVMGRQNRTKLEAVPQIISGLQARGYRFVTVSELLAAREGG